jgi:hypothetical protein
MATDGEEITMSNARWTHHVLWAVLVGALCLGVGASPATASSGHYKTLTLTGHWVDGPDDTTYLAPDCHPDAPPPGCRVTNTGHSKYTGDWAGSSQWQSGVLIASGTIYLQGIETFTGRVKGCGTGTMTWVQSLVIRGSEGTGTFKVIPGLGTGGLRRVTGSGTLNLHFNSDTSNHGRQHGRLRCPTRR